MRTRLSRYAKGAPNARRSRFWICRCRRLRRREPSGSRRIGIGGEDSLDRRGIPRRRIDDAGLPAARLDYFIKRQQRRKEAFGIHRTRCSSRPPRGIQRRKAHATGRAPAGLRPLPDRTIHRLSHQENSPLRRGGQAIHLDGLYQNRYACVRGPTFRLLTIGFFLVFMTALVKIQRKGQMTLPTKLRSLAGISEGDLVEAAFQRGKIVITPKLVIDRSKFPNADDEYTPAQRRAVNRGIAQSEKEIQHGRTFGPFNTHEEFIASLHKQTPKLRGKKIKRAAR